MSKKTTLERSYLHINNGGFSFSVIERTDVRKDSIRLPDDWSAQCRTMTEAQREEALAKLPRDDMHNRRWTFHIDTHSFGSGIRFSFPLVPALVKWMIWSLQRVLARMETPQELPTDGLEYALRNEEMFLKVVDGQPVSEDWPEPRPRNEDCDSEAKTKED